MANSTHELGVVEDTLYVPMLGRIYAHIDKSGLKFSTKASMVASDLLGMVKMVHLKL